MSKERHDKGQHGEASDHSQQPARREDIKWPSVYPVKIEPSPDDDKKYARDQLQKRRQLKLAYWLNWITGGAAGVALLGLVVLYGQIKVMKGQLVVTQGQLDEMQLDQRAWLAIKFVPTQPTLNSPFTWPLIINNIGKTPAKNIRAMVIIRYLPVGSSIDFRTIEQMRAAGVKQNESTPLWMSFVTGVLFPNDPTTLNQFTYAQGAAGEPQMNIWDSTLQDRYAKGEIYIEMNGRFEYDDAAGNAHWTQICDIATFPGQVIPLEVSKACVAHNDIDDNK